MSVHGTQLGLATHANCIGRSLRGYSIIEASDGPSGIRVLQSPARIDLLITDVGLPNGVNGRQVADAARELRPDMKVLFITGYAENAAIGSGNLGKGMHVVSKPFDMDVLATKIIELIEAREHVVSIVWPTAASRW